MLPVFLTNALSQSHCSTSQNKLSKVSEIVHVSNEYMLIFIFLQVTSDSNITLLDCLLEEHYENEQELNSLCAAVVNYSANSNGLHNLATQVITNALQREGNPTSSHNHDFQI